MSYNIIHVVRDLITGKLEFAKKDVVNHRLSICNPCEVKSRGICTACGCVVALKVRLNNSDCPMGLW